MERFCIQLPTKTESQGCSNTSVAVELLHSAIQYLVGVRLEGVTAAATLCYCDTSLCVAQHCTDGNVMLHGYW